MGRDLLGTEGGKVGTGFMKSDDSQSPTHRVDVGRNLLRAASHERLEGLNAVLPQFIVLHLAETHDQRDDPLKMFSDTMTRLTAVQTIRMATTTGGTIH